MTALSRTATALLVVAVLSLPACDAGTTPARITIRAAPAKPLTAETAAPDIPARRTRFDAAAKREACGLFATRIAPVFDAAVRDDDPRPALRLTRGGPGSPWSRFLLAVRASGDPHLEGEVSLLSGALSHPRSGREVPEIVGGRMAVAKACRG